MEAGLTAQVKKQKCLGCSEQYKHRCHLSALLPWLNTQSVALTAVHGAISEQLLSKRRDRQKYLAIGLPQMRQIHLEAHGSLYLQGSPETNTAATLGSRPNLTWTRPTDSWILMQTPNRFSLT